MASPTTSPGASPTTSPVASPAAELPGAYKLGRSWRIPEADLWGAQVGRSGDETERALLTARRTSAVAVRVVLGTP